MLFSIPIRLRLMNLWEGNYMGVGREKRLGSQATPLTPHVLSPIATHLSTRLCNHSPIGSEEEPWWACAQPSPAGPMFHVSLFCPLACTLSPACPLTCRLWSDPWKQLIRKSLFTLSGPLPLYKDLMFLCILLTLRIHPKPHHAACLAWASAWNSSLSKWQEPETLNFG